MPRSQVRALAVHNPDTLSDAERAIAATWSALGMSLEAGISALIRQAACDSGDRSHPLPLSRSTPAAPSKAGGSRLQA
jgi:hypothetical protein